MRVFRLFSIVRRYQAVISINMSIYSSFTLTTGSANQIYGLADLPPQKCNPPFWFCSCGPPAVHPRPAAQNVTDNEAVFPVEPRVNMPHPFRPRMVHQRPFVNKFHFLPQHETESRCLCRDPSPVAQSVDACSPSLTVTTRSWHSHDNVVIIRLASLGAVGAGLVIGEDCVQVTPRGAVSTAEDRCWQVAAEQGGTKLMCPNRVILLLDFIYSFPPLTTHFTLKISVVIIFTTLFNIQLLLISYLRVS